MSGCFYFYAQLGCPTARSAGTIIRQNPLANPLGNLRGGGLRHDGRPHAIPADPEAFPARLPDQFDGFDHATQSLSTAGTHIE
ncbi:MAG: hypothetical protein O3C40_35055 [Planctomycetota bacterium]|nr:hypothetical protein [Planctomycetota bacterium]